MTSTVVSRVDPDAMLRHLAGPRPGRLLHVATVPPTAGKVADLPEWVDPSVRERLGSVGVSQVWSHQRAAADAAWRGQHVILATGTASGKTLGYSLPTLTALAQGAPHPSGRGATALYLAPTKALAADQLRTLTDLQLPGLRAATYDGDTPPEQRRWIRRHASFVLTNPDLLHHSLLPRHEAWSGFLRALRFVVIDECHAYRGVFGAHVALVLRRLRRVCARYRVEPTFVFASATSHDPAGHASRLVGLPVRAILDSGAPRPGVRLALWEPPIIADETGAQQRRSVLSEAAELMADLVRQGAQTLTFTRSRAGAEVIAEQARYRLGAAGSATWADWAGSTGPASAAGMASVAGMAIAAGRESAAGADSTDGPGSPGGRAGSAGLTVAAYRGGYLPEDRRSLEADLRSGRLRGLASTNALELGIDVHSLDAVVLAGWPGTRGSFWQQVGRAGRAQHPALAVLIANDDPLDAYLVRHPEVMLEHPVEASVVDPTNPYVLADHLGPAAGEVPLTMADVELFGPGMTAVADDLCRRGLLRRRPTGWYQVDPERKAAGSLRGAGGSVRLVEHETGRVLGTVDSTRAPATVHTGAVYLHQGATFVVISLDLEEGVAILVPGDPGWFTTARSVSAFDILDVRRQAEHGDVRANLGRVSVRNQVVSFVRRLPGGEILGEHRLDLPEQILTTVGVWWTCSPEALTAAGLVPAQWPGSLHAAEHAAIGLLPLLATADRWDIGGVSTVCHPDTDLPTVMVYDGYRGGAGFAERGFEVRHHWLSATREAVSHCRCTSGCPACVQSPKCGNGNHPLDKAGAVRVLDLFGAGAVAGPAPVELSPTAPGGRIGSASGAGDPAAR